MKISVFKINDCYQRFKYKTEVTCLGTAPWPETDSFLISSLISIQVADAFVSLSDHIKLLGMTLGSRSSLDKHVSNVCSTFYFHIRALRHIRTVLDLESSKSIACAIVSPRLDYANLGLYRVSSYIIHRLQRVKKCLARALRQTHPLCYCISLLATCLHSLAAYPSASHFQAHRSSLL